MPDLNNKQIIVLLIVPCLVTKHIWERNVAALPEKQVRPLILLFFSPSPPPPVLSLPSSTRGKKKTAKLCLKWESLKKKKGGKYWLGRGRIIPHLCNVAHLRTINVIITPLPEGDLFFSFCPTPGLLSICVSDSLGWVTLCCVCMWWVSPECCRCSVLHFVKLCQSSMF